MNASLNSLRELFIAWQVDGYIISTRDEYLSEYPPAYARRLEYLTGFTGSNGVAIVLKETVLFFTDGRYLEQCRSQLNNKLFRVFDQKLLINFPWNDYISEDEIIGYDPHIFTNNSLLSFKKLSLKAIKDNLIDKIWHDRPEIISSRIYNYDINFAGCSSLDKIATCREFLRQQQGQGLLVTNPDSVCWLYNIRASDIEFSPILLGRALITDKEAYLFSSDQEFILPNISILPVGAIVSILENFNGKILFDDTQCPKYFSDLIKQKDYKIIQDPCLLEKACKNDVEIYNMREGHIEDGIAVCEFLAFLASQSLSAYDEYDLGLKLTEFRAKRKHYVSDSFPAIIGFKENGAVIHYRASKESAKKIIGDGLLLIDSGGQYLGATTDITRTISVGSVAAEYRKYYTKILKGHLALAMIKFPSDSITGANLDVLARQFLWQDGDDYPHGTGHGVGSFLSVHEGPQNISLNSYHSKFAKGMIVSNEPGFYQPGKFGIRIENMMVCTPCSKKDNEFLQFEMLTLVPYAKDMIDWDHLMPNEIEYIVNYYKMIEKKIMPHLSPLARKWLVAEMTLP